MTLFAQCWLVVIIIGNCDSVLSVLVGSNNNSTYNCCNTLESIGNCDSVRSVLA